MSAGNVRAETVRILREAADLIEPPARWTQGALARDKIGINVPPGAPEAVCWCARGAIIRVGGDAELLAFERFDYWLRHVKTGPYCTMGAWNDTRTGPEPVVAALREAAEAMEAVL